MGLILLFIFRNTFSLSGDLHRYNYLYGKSIPCKESIDMKYDGWSNALLCKELISLIPIMKRGISDPRYSEAIETLNSLMRRFWWGRREVRGNGIIRKTLNNLIVKLNSDAIAILNDALKSGQDSPETVVCIMLIGETKDLRAIPILLDLVGCDSRDDYEDDEGPCISAHAEGWLEEYLIHDNAEIFARYLRQEQVWKNGQFPKHRMDVAKFLVRCGFRLPILTLLSQEDLTAEEIPWALECLRIANYGGIQPQESFELQTLMHHGGLLQESVDLQTAIKLCWVDELSDDPRSYGICPVKLCNDPEIIRARKTGWIARIKKNRKEFDNCPVGLRDDPDIAHVATQVG